MLGCAWIAGKEKRQLMYGVSGVEKGVYGCTKGDRNDRRDIVAVCGNENGIPADVHNRVLVGDPRKRSEEDTVAHRPRI